VAGAGLLINGQRNASFRDHGKSYFRVDSRLDCRNAECRLSTLKVNFTGLAGQV
jgi:hypothetical protein